MVSRTMCVFTATHTTMQDHEGQPGRRPPPHARPSAENPACSATARVPRGQDRLWGPHGRTGHRERTRGGRTYRLCS